MNEWDKVRKICDIEYQKYEKSAEVPRNIFLERTNIPFDDIKDIIQSKLLVELDKGQYRSIFLEMLRLLIDHRISLRGDFIVRSFKLRRRQYPRLKFDEDLDFLEKYTTNKIKNGVVSACNVINIKKLTNFQKIAIENIFTTDEPHIISAPTGTGKTLIFLLPVLIRAIENNKKKGTKALIIYPRKALSSDQLEKLLGVIIALEDVSSKDLGRIYIGIDDGSTARRWYKPGDRYSRHEQKFRGIKCPLCAREKHESSLIVNENEKTIKCERCNRKFKNILYTKEEIWNNPADIIITNNYALSQRLMMNESHTIFGRGCEVGPKYIIIDEVHTYKEELGGHMANIIKRLQNVIRYYNPEVNQKFIGCSATIESPEDFGKKIFDSEVIVEEYPQLESKDTTRDEYHFFVLPRQEVATMFLGIQTASIFGHFYRLMNPKNKILMFIDSISECERMKNLLNENEIDRIYMSHITNGDDPTNPFNWGHLFESSEQPLRVDIHHSKVPNRERIEDEIKRGVLDVIISTSTLELGIDIGDVAAVIQYKVPRAFDGYIQRVGRAGRKTGMTVSCCIMANSSYEAFYFANPELLVFPEFKTPVATDNDYINKKHARAAILDYVACNGAATGADWSEFVNAKDVMENIVKIIDEKTNDLKHWLSPIYTNPLEVIYDFRAQLKNALGKEIANKNLVGMVESKKFDEAYLKLKETKRNIEKIEGEIKDLNESFRKKYNSLGWMILKLQQKALNVKTEKRIKNLAIQLAEDVK